LWASVPAFALPQVPSVPEILFSALQAWHTPLQAVSQQTPSTQKPEVHSCAAVHALPRSCLALHCPPAQYALGTQPLSSPQVWGQLDPKHTNGSHFEVPPATHAPSPLHC